MARRVNTKFLIILTAIVVTLGVGALVANLVLARESPEKFVATGQQLMAEKKYEEAAKAFGRAVQLNQKNPALWVQYGDACNELTPVDLEWLQRARSAWASALAIDPAYKPALDRMMQWYSDVANLDQSSPATFKGLHETATRLFAADKNNAAAEVAIQTSIIRPWLNGVEDDPARIAKAVDALLALMKKYPDNPDIPLFVAQARVKEAERARQREQGEEAKRLALEAQRIMDEAIKNQPSGGMYFSAAQVAYGQEALGLGENPEQIKQWRDQWREKRKAYYAKALENVKETDALFVMIHIQAARATADKPESVRILKKLQQARPEDQEVRYALAEQLASDKATRQEALAVLDLPFAGQVFRGPNAFKVRELQIRSLVLATNLRLDILAGSGDEQERKENLDKIQKNLEVIALRDGEGPRLLRLRGKLLRLQGKTIDAIQTLERAKALAEQNAAGELGGEGLDRWEVTDMLARAYLETKQTGNAKELLTELTNRFPQYDQSRMLLTQVLIREGQLDEAAKHVKILAQNKPDDPDVIKFQLQIADPKSLRDAAGKEKERAATKANYARLPETTKGQALEKVVAAMVIDQSADAIRIINKLLAQTPADLDVVRMAIRVHRQLNDVDSAKAVVEAALKAKPGDAELLVIQRQVADLTPENLARITIEEAEKNPDLYLRAMIKANAFRRLGKPEEQLKNLQEAIKVKPNDGDANALLFHYYLERQQWAKAEALLPTLAAVNQDQTGGLLFRYKLAMAKQDYPTAMNYARALVQRMGEFGQSWLALAQAQHATNLFEEALKNYNTALEKQSDNADALGGAIQCLYALNKPADAKRKIDDARRTLPNNAMFQEMEVQHEMTWGNPEKAIGPREEQVKKTPDKPEAYMSLGQAYLQTGRNRASKPDTAMKAPEMFAKARDTFKQGITKWPDEIAFYAYYAETATRSGELGDTESVLKQLPSRDAWKGKPEPQLLLAEYYGIARRPADAEAVFRAVMEKFPTADTQIKLANLLINQRKHDEAIKVLDSANPSDVRVAKRKVDVLLAANRAADAEGALDQALKANPSSLDLLQLAAGVHIATGKFEMADLRLKRALEVDPANPTTHYYVGLMKMSQGEPDLKVAIEHLEKARTSASMGIEARFALAEALRRRDNQDAAIRELEDALKGQPSNRRVRVALIDAYTGLVPPRNEDARRLIREAKSVPNWQPDAEILRREASLLAASEGQYKEAVDRINEAVAASPDDMALVRQALDLYVKARRFADVYQRVDQLLAKDKNLWWAYQARAVARRQQGNKEEAVKDFEAAFTAAIALQDERASEEVIRTMGDVIGVDEAINRISGRAEKEDRWKIITARLQQTKGDNASAVKTLEQVLARDEQLVPTDRADAYRFGGTLYLIAGQADKSAHCYNKLLAMAPNDMTALNNLACLLAEVMQPPKPQEGLQYSQRAYDLMVKAGRRDPLVLDTHGWVLVKCGKIDEGIEILRRANEIRATPDAHYHLGEAYLTKQFGPEAQAELEKALNLVKKMTAEKQPLDMTLQPKIEGAIARAGVMIRQKLGGGGAPSPAPPPSGPAAGGGTGGNVPTAANVPANAQ